MSNTEVRLIDANSFKRFLQALCKAGAPYDEVIQLLDKEPTAFDKEIVGWIPCSERLPEECKRVLLCTKDKQVCQGKRIIFCEHNRYDLDGLLRYCFDDEIIAWQPLPEPYKEGGAENDNKGID